MTEHLLIKSVNSLFLRLLFVFSLFSCASAIYAQTNFSGTWVQDNVKSDDFYKEFDITCVITQTPQTFTIKSTFFDKSGKEITTREASFNLDGKEVSKEEAGGINKDMATWSPDKKTLTTKSTRTVGTDVYGSTVTYSLSGNILTVQTSDINPLGLSVKQIFNRKK
jgi:hypothetical protein